MDNLHRKAALAAAICFSLPGAVQAQRVEALGPVTVTATRSEVAVEEVLASVTVLTRADIELSQAPDLVDLLSRQAGIDIARTGGPGQASTLFMRGTNSNHTLILVDGIRVNTATQGLIDFAHLPLAQIERIEIVRGPRAALWGSDAIGGVIHIFTRDPSKAFFEARTGSYGRAGLGAGAGMSRGGSSLGVAAGGEDLRGFSATNDLAYGFDPDTDGYRNRNLSLHAQAMLGTQKLSLSGLVTDADVEFDQGGTAALNRVLGVTLGGPLSEHWNHSLVLGHTSEDLDTPAYLSRFGSERDSLDWINTIAMDASGTLDVGLNWSRESGYSDDGFAGFEQTRGNAALFAAWRGHWAAQTIELSLRRDENEQFDGATTGSFAWGWQANDALRLRASWGQGFRAPNFNELYYPGFFGLFEGNPDLQPERSSSTELGIDWRLGAAQNLGLSLYQTRVNELIAFEGTDFQAVNINRAAIDGIELDYHFAHGALSIDGNATWQNATDADSGERLLRRPDRKINLSVGYRFDSQATVACEASAYSSRPDFGGASLAGYARVDLLASAPLAAGWTFEARLENLADRDYVLVSGYNTPGRSGVLSLRWNAE